MLLRLLPSIRIAAGSLGLAIAAATLGAIAGPARADVPLQMADAEAPWVLAQVEVVEVEIVTGRIEAIDNDRVRLDLADGGTRLIGITQNDRDALALRTGDAITVALTDTSFFAQAVAKGEGALAIAETGNVVRVSDGTVVVRRTTATAERTPMQEAGPAPERQQPQRPVRAMW